MKPQPSNPHQDRSPEWEEDDYSFDFWDQDEDDSYFEPMKRRNRSRPDSKRKELRRNKKDRQQRQIARQRKHEPDYDWGGGEDDWS